LILIASALAGGSPAQRCQRAAGGCPAVDVGPEAQRWQNEVLVEGETLGLTG